MVVINPLLYFNETFLSRTRRQTSGQANGDVGEVIFVVNYPKNNVYNYSDSNVEPFTAYEYRIRTSTNAG